MTKIDVINAKLDLLFKCVQLSSVTRRVPDACRFMLTQHQDRYIELMRDWDAFTIDGEWLTQFGGRDGEEKSGGVATGIA